MSEHLDKLRRAMEATRARMDSETEAVNALYTAARSEMRALTAEEAEEVTERKERIADLRVQFAMQDKDYAVEEVHVSYEGQSLMRRRLVAEHKDETYTRVASPAELAAEVRAAEIRTREYTVAGPSEGRAVTPAATGPVWTRSADGLPATVARGESFAQHRVVASAASRESEREAAVIGAHGDLGSLVRSMTTTSGSAIVPTVWAADVIDRARNYAAVLQAGAQLVPMDAKTVQIGRLTGDPSAAFRAEGSLITASDPAFDNVTLTATTMSTLVVGSMEWFQDATNVDQVVSDAIAKAIALQLDLVALYGSITTGAGSINLPTPPNPRGVLAALNATAPANVLGAATNGTTQTATSFWNEILDTIYTVRDGNEEPTGLIWSSKAARLYAKSYDTTGQPLAVPAAVSAVPQYVSNQVPSYTQGTMTNVATDVFVGDWRELLIGQRLGLRIETLTERYAEYGQIGIVAHWRGDVQPARPKAFAAYKALKGA